MNLEKKNGGIVVVGIWISAADSLGLQIKVGKKKKTGNVEIQGSMYIHVVGASICGQHSLEKGEGIGKQEQGEMLGPLLGRQTLDSSLQNKQATFLMHTTSLLLYNEYASLMR